MGEGQKSAALKATTANQEANYARIVKRAPAEPLSAEELKTRPPSPKQMEAGTYRVIHGRLAVPRPTRERLGPDGSINAHVSSFIYAEPGDEVELSEKDATAAYAAGTIEPLSTSPSQRGKVWTPPKVREQLSYPTHAPHGVQR